jgi:hypothetical protein
MAEIPEGIVLKRHRELQSPGFNRRVRYALLTLIAAFLVVGVVNTFGQRPSKLFTESAAAKLEVYAPTRLRGGLMYEARFTIVARQELKSAALELSPGWSEGMQTNTIEPSPVGEASRNGNLLFTLGHVPKGNVFRLFMQFQVNPTNVAWRRVADVKLYDGGKLLVTVHRRVTIFP